MVESIEWVIKAGLVVIGVFTFCLGSVHFFFPVLLDFAQAIPKEGPPLKPFRLGFIHYATQRRDVHGIAWVMNYATSYVLVTLGILQMGWWWWLPSPAGRILALWIAGWWFLRAGSQLYLGQRRGDWWIMAGFGSLGVWLVLAAFIL
jgi:hypothetical protein